MSEKIEKIHSGFYTWRDFDQNQIKPNQEVANTANVYWANGDTEVPSMNPTVTAEPIRFNFSDDTIKSNDSKFKMVEPSKYVGPKNDFSSYNEDDVERLKIELNKYAKLPSKMNKFSSSSSLKGVSTNTEENIIQLTDNSGRQVLRFEQNGDIYVKNEFVTNDFQIVEGFREFLKHYKLHP